MNHQLLDQIHELHRIVFEERVLKFADSVRQLLQSQKIKKLMDVNGSGKPDLVRRDADKARRGSHQMRSL